MANCNNCIHEQSCQRWIRHGTTLYDDFDYSVKNCPYYQMSVNDPLIRYGVWFDERESSNDVPKILCSECGRVIYDLESEYNYCPSCGAKMTSVDEYFKDDE